MKFSRRLLAVILPILFLFFFVLAAFAAESEYRRCDTGTTACQIGEFLYDDDYVPVPPANAACTLAVRDPSGTLLNDPPGYYTTSETADGWYSYNFDTTGQVDGLYRSTMCCTVTTPSQTLCLDKSFTIGPSTEDAVLDADLTDHVAPGTFGWYFQNPLGLVKDIWEYSTRTLSDFGSLIADIWDNATRSLTTRGIAPGENIAQEETAESRWTTLFAGDGEVAAGKTYKAKLRVLNYLSELADADANPTYKIYDPLGMQAATGTMTKDATGVYSLSYSVSGVATAGRWETVVDLTAGGSAIQDGSFWEVEGSPAQVTINSITDNTVPSITASATIKNEGSSGAEYRYEWCVVSQQTNPCGGGDDIYHASAAEFFNAGQSKTKNLNATVPNPGTYYFKLVVLWGTERSGASQQFNATTVACLGDYNSDGWVDLTNFSIQLFYWNQYNPAHDLSGDGYVNLTDFSILLFHWGKCP